MRKITFSECYQTLKNILQYNFQNATKHLKIFSPENILDSENCSHVAKHSLSNILQFRRQMLMQLLMLPFQLLSTNWAKPKPLSCSTQNPLKHLVS